MDRDRSVKDRARRGGTLHSAWKPSRKGNLSRFPGCRKKQEKTDDHRLRGSQSWKSVSEGCRSRPMVHGDDPGKQSNVTCAIYTEDVKTVFDGSTTLVEKTDPQH